MAHQHTKASCVALIPARGGSKRIPGKNTRLFLGQPIIAYSIQAAQKTGLFDRIIVSTDDPTIAAVAEQYGAECPFLRPLALADDYTPLITVVQHALSQDILEEGLLCCLLATAPFIQSDDLLRGQALLEQHPDKSYAFSVTPFEFPVQRALYETEQGALQALYPEYRMTRSQDLPQAIHDAGQFYWGRKEAWIRGDILYSPCSLPVKIPPERVQDIDTEAEWRRAEYMMRLWALEKEEDSALRAPV